MTWAIKRNYGYAAVEVMKETEKTVLFVDRSWGGSEVRADRAKFLDWRGEEDVARKLVAQLTSARAECDRRKRAAVEWLKAQEREIVEPLPEPPGSR